LPIVVFSYLFSFENLCVQYDSKALDEIVSVTSGYHIIQEFCSSYGMAWMRERRNQARHNRLITSNRTETRRHLLPAGIDYGY
jgi:hypothetical protein